MKKRTRSYKKIKQQDFLNADIPHLVTLAVLVTVLLVLLKVAMSTLGTY